MMMIVEPKIVCWSMPITSDDFGADVVRLAGEINCATLIMSLAQDHWRYMVANDFNVRSVIECANRNGRDLVVLKSKTEMGSQLLFAIL